MSHPFIPDGVELRGALDAAGEQVLTADALKFVGAH